MYHIPSSSVYDSEKVTKNIWNDERNTVNEIHWFLWVFFANVDEEVPSGFSSSPSFVLVKGRCVLHNIQDEDQRWRAPGHIRSPPFVVDHGPTKHHIKKEAREHIKGGLTERMCFSSPTLILATKCQRTYFDFASNTLNFLPRFVKWMKLRMDKWYFRHVGDMPIPLYFSSSIGNWLEVLWPFLLYILSPCSCSSLVCIFMTSCAILYHKPLFAHRTLHILVFG